MGIASSETVVRGARAAGVFLVSAGFLGCGTTSVAPEFVDAAGPDGGGPAPDLAGPEPGDAEADSHVTMAPEGGDGGDASAQPPPPTWNPPFAVGSPGWKSSTTPFCTNNNGDFLAYDVWSDSRGVFALASANCNVLGNVACGQEGASLQFNDGTGWKSVYRSMDNDEVRLSGFDGGAAILAGGACGVTFVDPASGHATCTSVLPNLVGAAFVGGARNAYAWDGTKLDHYDGAQWSSFATLPFSIAALWAEDQIAVAVGSGQAITLKGPGTNAFQAMPGVPAGDYGAVWAFSANDVWAGNRAGQLVHYDGAWHVYETGSEDTTGDGVSQIWGSQGKIFFRTGSELGRWNGSSPEILVHKNGRIVISGIWGNSPTEVFVSLFDSNYEKYACAGLFVLYYDGQTFHQF